MAHKIQIAIQGGGAKLVALLAAMDAVRKDREICVTRIIGTSAGAIAACLFACGAEPEAIKSYFSQHRDQFIFRMPGRSRALYQFCFGMRSAFWNGSPITSVLTHFLKNDYTEFNHFKQKNNIAVTVVSTDLKHAKAVHHTGSSSIIDSVMDSCGLPFLFRVPGKSGELPLVDGGLCENLPLESLLADVAEYGPVVAITFKKPPPCTHKDIPGFTLSLLDSAISNSVERSKNLLSKHFVHEIDTKIETFDFSAALDENTGLGKDYESVFASTKQYLSNLKNHLNHAQNVAPMLWESNNAAMDGLLHDCFHASQIIEGSHSIARKKVSYVVTASCLFPEGDQRRGMDIVRRMQEFLVLDNPVSCYVTGTKVTTGTPFYRHADYYIEHEGRIIREKNDMVVIPAKDPEKPDYRRFLFFFKPIQKSDNPYRFVFQNNGMGFMQPLETCGKDIVAYNSHRFPIELLDIVLHMPDTYRRLSVFGESPGHQLSPQELARDHRPPPGFRSYGWRAENVKAGEKIFFNIQ